jgi:hypothetical protein
MSDDHATGTVEPEARQESFRICRDEIQHEYSILGNRLNSYITSQSFLATGYAIAMGNNNSWWGHTFRLVFPLTLCLLGILLSVRAHPGIVGACHAIKLWHGRQNQLLDGGGFPDYVLFTTEEYKRAQSRSLYFSQAAAWIFAVGWVVFLLLAIWVFNQP